MCAAIIAVAAENKFLSIRAKHGECIKTFIPADLLHVLSFQVGEVHIKREASFIFVITAKDYVFSIRRKIRCPVSLL